MDRRQAVERPQVRALLASPSRCRGVAGTPGHETPVELRPLANETVVHKTGFNPFAGGELEKIGLIDRQDVIGGTLVRVARAYPAYFGAYSRFGELRTFLDRFSNLYPIGRNGMHRYNNQDHSMLTANAAVDAITNKSPKEEIWNINAEESYHEEADRRR